MERAVGPASDTHVRMHMGNLSRLTTRREDLNVLRRAIGYVAVTGRFVSSKTVREAPATAPVETGANDGCEFNGKLAVPEDWSIVKLSHVADTIVDCPHSTPKWTKSGKMCVRTNQFRPGRLDL